MIRMPPEKTARCAPRKLSAIHPPGTVDRNTIEV